MSELGGQIENPFASPQSEEAGVVSNPTPAWRDGELVVVAGSGRLPERCVKCGRPAEASLEEVETVTKISYRPRAVAFSIAGLVSSFAYMYLTISRPAASFLNPLGVGAVGCIASIVFAALYATRVAASVTVSYVYCSKHNRVRRLCHYGVLAGYMLLLGIFCFDHYSGRQRVHTTQLIPLATLPMIILSTWLKQVTNVTVQLKYTEAEYSWLSGFGKPFVDSLLPYDESAEESSAANDKS